MKIMKSLKVGCRDINIILSPESPLHDKYGVYMSDKNSIYLEDISSDTEFVETFLHEIIHVLVRNGGLNLEGQPLKESEEVVTTILATQLTELFANNKPLLLYLYAKLHNFEEEESG